MKIGLALTLDKDAQSKGVLINKLFSDINVFIQNKNYGNGVLEYLIICQIVNPPNGYEHLHKEFKPKFIEHKSMTNRLTGERLIIEKQFSYSIKINGSKFDEFIKATDTESTRILASEVLASLSNLDTLHKRVKDFDKVSFKADIRQFFEERNLV